LALSAVVTPSTKEFLRVGEFLRAGRELSGWIMGARALAVLISALESGVLEALRIPSTQDELASGTELDSPDVDDLCAALEALGVAERRGDVWQLTSNYALLASPDAAVPLSSLIRYARFIVATLEGNGSTDQTYTALPPEDVLAVADVSGISALSPSPHVSPESTRHTIPEIGARWSSGAHHLEAGCGVGNALLGTALTYPNVTAVGIEIDDLTAIEARRRAELLGVADRVEVRCMDVCDLTEEATFDTAQWSQFFFPTESREPALAAIRQALRPGGYLLMTCLGSSDDVAGHRGEMMRLLGRSVGTGGASFLSFLNDAAGDTPRRRSRERRSFAQQRLLFRRWGIPVLSMAELEQEAENAGFTVVRSTHTPASSLYLTRGLLLVQRSA
jgi:cyclopropane fatty-acyl-phospholipid synthase-like methyltransferase